MPIIPAEPTVGTNNWYGWATGVDQVVTKANTSIADDGTIVLPQLTSDPSPPPSGKMEFFHREDHGIYFLGSTSIRRRIVQNFGSATSFPATALAADTVFRSDIGCLFAYTGAAWRQRDLVTVANATARTALSTSFSSAIHLGFYVSQTDIDAIYVWDGAHWLWTAGGPEVYSFSYRTPTGGVGPYIDYVVPLRIYKYGRNCIARGAITYVGSYAANAQATFNVADLPGTPTGLAPPANMSSTSNVWTGSAQGTMMALLTTAGVLQVTPYSNIATGLIYNFNLQWTSPQ